MIEIERERLGAARAEEDSGGFDSPEVEDLPVEDREGWWTVHLGNVIIYQREDSPRAIVAVSRPIFDSLGEYKIQLLTPPFIHPNSPDELVIVDTPEQASDATNWFMRKADE